MAIAIREKLGVKPPQVSISYVNMLIYGEPGVGKTTFAGTAEDHPDTSPAVLLDIEGGVAALRHRSIDVVQVRTVRDLVEVQDEIKKDIDSYYKTVIIDGFTEMQKLDMRTVMQEQYDKKPETTDLYVPSQREWGKSGERMRIMVRMFRDLECNLIATCLLAEDTDDRTNVKSYFPSLPGKLRSEIPGFFDIVGLLRTVEEKGEDGRTVVERTMQFAKTSRVSAKDRFSILGDLMRSPSVPLIWELISQSNKDANNGKEENNV